MNQETPGREVRESPGFIRGEQVNERKGEIPDLDFDEIAGPPSEPAAIPTDLSASGCCGCGSRHADVRTPASPGYPLGETYCRRCARRLGAAERAELPG